MAQHALHRERATTRAFIMTLLAGTLMAGAFLSLVVIGTRMASEQQGIPVAAAHHMG